MDGRDQIPSPLELFVEHCSTLLVVDETYPSQIKKIQTKNPQHNNKSPIKKKKRGEKYKVKLCWTFEDAVLCISQSGSQKSSSIKLKSLFRLSNFQTEGLLCHSKHEFQESSLMLVFI